MEKNVTLQVSLTEDIAEKAGKQATEQKITIEEYIENLVTEEVTVIRLMKGFTYRSNTGKLYSPTGSLVPLTRREEKILETLIKNTKEVVPLEDFFKAVWNRDKNTNSLLFSLRNFIKSIRDKTDYELIKSISGIGYSVKFN